MVDILIKGGNIIDGTGAPAYQADVAILDEKILEISPEITYEAERVIDASGLTVTPGFIDTHSHGDFIALLPLDFAASLEQGITTQLAGHCGDSMAPYPATLLDPKLPTFLTMEQAERLRTICESPQSFMEHAVKTPLALNTAFLIGHNSIRAHAMGYGDGKPTEAQMNVMKETLRQAMEHGMYGYSSGLMYAPSCYGDTEELTELAKVAAEYGGIYATHIRGEGLRVFEALEEALEIGRASGADVWVSHLKIMGHENRGRASELLGRIHDARKNGQKVYTDQYPYEAGSAPLIAQIPPKYLIGGNEKTLCKIADPEVRRQIEHSIFHEVHEFESAIFDCGWEGTVITEAAATPNYTGKSIAEIAAEESRTPIDVMMDLLIKNSGVVQCLYFTQDMKDVMTILSDPTVFTGMDWSIPGERPDPKRKYGSHPRGCATFVHKLELRRNYGILSPEESIRSMTGAPAEALGFTNRGLIREGFFADLCILDFEHLHSEADYIYPMKRNQGIHYVFVNGGVAVEKGHCTGGFFGKTIQKQKK